jgi:hypothetical protein
MFTNNFYTQHTIAKQLHCITDGNVFMIGTVKFTNVDAMNQIHLTTAIRNLMDTPIGAWNLIQVFDNH